MNRDQRYVLITAARNEAGYIEYPIWSVLTQKIRPERWAIVSDGSTDGTDDIIMKYAARYDFIAFRRRERDGSDAGFASKVHALRAGAELLQDVEYDYIGHLDADVSFHSDFYERLLKECEEDPRLGVCGGFVHEKERGRFRSRSSNRTGSVAGAVQFFRRGCYEDIGPFVPLPMGGEDTHAEVSARMRGWKVASFPDLKVFHHKVSRDVRDVLRENWRYGRMDYLLGSDPLFEILKCLRRVPEKPCFVSASVRLAGYLWFLIRREERPVSEEFMRHIREEQAARLGLKRIFYVGKINEKP